MRTSTTPSAAILTRTSSVKRGRQRNIQLLETPASALGSLSLFGLVIAAYHYDAGYSRTIPKTAVALLDSSTDAVTIVKDERCGAFSTAAMTASGDLYFGEDTYAVALHRIAGDGGAPDGCLLRMKAGQDVFDPSFFVRVSALTGGQLGGAAIAGGGESIWVRAFDESLFPVSAVTSGTAILAAPAWRWWKLDGANPSTAAVSSLPPGAGEVKWFSVAGRAYAGDANADYSMTAVVDLSAANPARGIVLRGHPSGILKVR